MVDTLESLSLTNLDASPVIPNTAGVGAPGIVKQTQDFVTPTTGGLGSTSSIYKVVRVPMQCYLKKVTVVADAALDTNGSPTLAIDVGAYYSDSTTDGTPVALQGTLISANAFIAAALFGATTDLSVNSDGHWSAAHQNSLLWSALGLTSPTGYFDGPGGNIDIVVAVHTIAATAASHAFTVRADVVMPG